MQWVGESAGALLRAGLDVHYAFPECFTPLYRLPGDSSQNAPREERMSIWLALRWMYMKTSGVVGNLRIKDVAGDVVFESSHTHCTLRPM